MNRMAFVGLPVVQAFLGSSGRRDAGRPGVFTILYRPLDAKTVIPAASSVRWWLQRLGLYALQEPLLMTGDWVLPIEHSVQMGATKACVIPGIHLSEVPYPHRALRFEDMHVIAVIPIEQSTGEIVDVQLEQATQRIGIPGKSFRIQTALEATSVKHVVSYGFAGPWCAWRVRQHDVFYPTNPTLSPILSI